MKDITMFRFVCMGLVLCCALPGPAQALLRAEPVWSAKHGPQGTGNYKGKRDRHEKATPMHEKKRQSSKWVPQKKK